MVLVEEHSFSRASSSNKFAGFSPGRAIAAGSLSIFEIASNYFMKNTRLESLPKNVLSALEPEQLAAAKHRFPRRVLKGGEVFLLWSLRIYLLFMMAVVIYQMVK